MADPVIEALDSEETPEEKAAIDAALEASEEIEVSDASDTGGEQVSEQVAEKESQEDTGEGTGEGAEEVSEEEVESLENILAQQNRELKQILREQKKEMAAMKAQLSRVEKVQDTEYGDEETPKELSHIEQMQQEIEIIGQQRGPIFETLVEAMELNPKYADIREVCSREHLDDILEMAAEVVVSEQGGDPMEVQYALESELWKSPNPYRIMYGIIKERHPKYAKKPVEKTVSRPAARPKEAPEAPASIANVGGGDQDSKSGWTTKRIDNLPEDELDKVPQGVYEKYLRDELD